MSNETLDFNGEGISVNVPMLVVKYDMLYSGQFITPRTQTIPPLIVFREAEKTYSTGVNYEGKMAYQKRRLGLLNHLESLKSKGVITDSDIREIMFQHYLLELRRQELVSHMGEVVVVCNGELFFGKNLNEAVEQAKKKYGDKPYYSETVNMVDYPSPFG